MSTQHNDSRRSFTCDICEKEFSTPGGVAYHKKTVHDKVREFCEICGQEFKSIANLKHHVQRKHMEEKTHSCNTCSKSFFTKGDLMTHEKRKHPSSEWQKCDICDWLLEEWKYNLNKD